jgi:uncharacterized protein YndB with AHSA1/START domain
MQTVEIRKIVVEVPIKAPVEKTWKIMFEQLPEWWPKDFLCYAEAEKIRFEPWAGGRLYEEAPDGRQILWSTLISIEPGRAMDFVGYMTPSYGGPSMTMYRLEVKPTDTGDTLFKLTDVVMGRTDDEHEASLNEGWTFLFEQGLKAYVEKHAGV